jgi:putative peptidoglycan lipid II flippase
VVLNVMLVRSMGYRGLALGTSITAIVNAALQMYLLRREIQSLHGARIAASFARVIVASAIMGVVAATTYNVMLGLMPGAAIITQIVRLLITITLALISLTAAAQLLRIQEFGEARDLVLGKFKRMVG